LHVSVTSAPKLQTIGCLSNISRSGPAEVIQVALCFYLLPSLDF
jgi:hypothetical protein